MCVRATVARRASVPASPSMAERIDGTSASSFGEVDGIAYRCRTPSTAIFVLWSKGAGSTGSSPTRVSG